MSVFVEPLDIGGSGPQVGIKDTIDVAGVRTRAGSRPLESVAPARANADVVEGLLAAGYHLAGKTNLHELAFGTTGINHWTGDDDAIQISPFQSLPYLLQSGVDVFGKVQ